MPVPDARLEQLRSDLTGRRGRLYVGRGVGGPAFAAPESALLVIGPPRSGKTSGLVVPNVLCAPGAVVSTSTKPDVLEATLGVRSAVGRCWLLDPTGTVAVPEGVTPVRWSPVAAAGTWEEALGTARAMVGTARPGGAVGESAHWTERAEALLAPLLHAAALGGGDMRRVQRWVLRTEAGPAATVLAGCGAGTAADVLAGITATDAREQSGIWSTAAGVLAAYRSDAALAATVEPNIDPAALAAGTDTVYVCAPGRNQGLVAPVIVAFLEAVRAGAYRRAAGPTPTTTPLSLVLDEVANIAPLPDLPALVSEGGSQGVVTMACLQDLAQARQRWGPAADGFPSLFGAKVVLPGVADLATLELVSRLGGEIDLPARSVNRSPWWGPRRAGPSVTWSTRRQRRLPVDAVRQLPPGSALLLDGAASPTLVGVPPWWDTEPFAGARRAGRAEAGRGAAPGRPAAGRGR